MENHEYKLNMYLKPISNKKALKIVQRIHQSSDTLPTQTKHCLGVYINDILEGVITLGYGTRPKHTIQKLFPSLNISDYYEIGRMCINNDYKTNTESQMLSKTMKYIKKNFPNIKLIFTWANGLLGKIGTVYQASNFLYGGYIKTDCYVKDGIQIHPRRIKKLLHPKDPRQTVRPTSDEKINYQINHFKGKQFMYVYFLCGKTQKRNLIKESPYTWNNNYPKLEDCQWEKWVAPKRWESCHQPTINTDYIGTLSLTKNIQGTLDDYFKRDW